MGKKNQYDVVILDSGIKKNHEIFNQGIDTLQVFFDELSNQYFVSDMQEESFGHGTAITSIVQQNAMDNTSILSIKISSCLESTTDEETLIAALNYVFNNIEPTVINMSLGITRCSNIAKLYEVCRKLDESGFILISAFDNDGAFSYPAVFDCVIGVISGDKCKSIKEYEIYNDSVINIGAFGKLQRVSWDTPNYILMGGNSLACAHVTAYAIELFHKGAKTIKNIINGFLERAVYVYDGEIRNSIERNRKIPFEIKRAALFPFNKEMHSIIRFSHLLPFEISDVYETNYSLMIGNTTSAILKDKQVVEDYLIRNIEDINFEDIDTLILGHTGEMSQFDKIYMIKNKLIDEAKKHNINIYSFDEIDSENCPNIYYPRVTEDDMPMRRFGMLYQISKPVIGIFGTSSKQGKYTLQLKLRQKFSNLGYKVGQIGTEPSALLFGMDEVFPVGYNSSVHINGYDSIIYLNNIMMRVANTDNDLILVGSQSGTVSYYLNNISNCCLAEYEFLLGTQPDAVVLCANSFDELDYLTRTVKFIEGSIQCRVVAVVIFPVDRRNDWLGQFGRGEELTIPKYEEVKNLITRETSLPVYRLDSEDSIEQLCDVIIDCFNKK